MKKVFLYLYPIEEFTNALRFSDETCTDFNIEKPIPVLNETIDKRYRQKGYQIVFCLYPDKKLYGVQNKDTDKIIYTDITFEEATSSKNGVRKDEEVLYKYPNEQLLINQLGDIDELIVGGYHATDCVKKVAECAYNNGINTLVDLDLTDLFFTVYYKKDYFDIENYDQERFRTFKINEQGEDFVFLRERLFDRKYNSPVYGFSKILKKR